MPTSHVRALTKRFPKDHLIRVRVWTPDPFRGQTHRSVQTEGPVPAEVARVLEDVALYFPSLTPNELAQLMFVAGAIRGRAERELDELRAKRKT